MVLSDQPSVNFNTTWKLSAGKTDTGIARSLIQFPLSEIPAGVKVDAARLGMYYDQVAHHQRQRGDHRGAPGDGFVDESTATWSNTSALVGELSGTTVQHGRRGRRDGGGRRVAGRHHDRWCRDATTTSPTTRTR